MPRRQSINYLQKLPSIGKPLFEAVVTTEDISVCALRIGIRYPKGIKKWHEKHQKALGADF